MGDVVFDTLYSSNVPFINNVTYQLSTVQSAGAALDKTGKPLVLMGHSQAGIPPPSSKPMRDSNLQRHSLVLLVRSESGYHGVYGYCTAEHLKQAGYSITKHLELGKAGIHGRSHMFLMENNSDQFSDHQGLHCQDVT
ncbi:hypothetical protein MGU_09318 [Metarhizium guizhouense ARSEF 977]|uniref:Uncharacterized protein n=1 Tax=Metarhizium guizhouense (strain ARSEF 977) TaxID=1276136 RepID=A0A0B4GUN9_METGA|nr:hypothetical protein MGU_09318 [Metarhizium guizhouense ARSEF 977]